MLQIATTITFIVIFGFIFAIVFLATYFAGYDEMPLIILLTIGINILTWLLSPFFMDLMFRWFYKSTKLDLPALQTRAPKLAAFLEKTCSQFGIKIPRLRLIIDDNPTAFAFGSGQYNARLCFSEGLFTYLAEDEIAAVIGHELGHIKRRDFIIMTIASTGVQILYELSQFLRKRGGGRGEKKSALATIGLLSYIFYIIATYLLLFLSRTREYGADEFSAHVTGNPDALSRALVKIAYGIVAKPDDAGQQRLLNATRALGPYDSHAARHLGTAYEVSKHNISNLSPVLAYDFLSPWAKILELQSTHPLTGKRIRRLNGIALGEGKKVSIDTEAASLVEVDHHKLYSGFALGVIIHFLPMIAIFGVFGVSIAQKNDLLLAWIPGALGIALLIKMLYKYPAGEEKHATTYELMSDIYASPVRGKRYALEGTIIGRGVAGAQLSEDVMLQDKTGLLYLNYESAIPFFGNLIFAIGKVRKLIGKSVKTAGWFFRDVGHHFDVDVMETESGKIQSHPRLWGVIIAVVLVIITFYAQSKITEIGGIF